MTSSRPSRSIVLALVAVLAAVSLLSACGSDNPDASGSATTGAPAASTTTTGGQGGAPAGAAGSATISNFSFQPAEIKAAVGDTITWTNKDGFAHTVKADDGSFDSGDIAADGTFSNTFATAGTFTYFCGIHNYMKGSVVVS